MLLLMPLRGWVGDAMAVEMMGRHAPATPVAAVAQAADHDCAGHGQAAEPGVLPAASDCPTCASCQVCSSVAVIFVPAAAVAPLPTAAVLWRVDTRFASAEPVPAFKPPIS